MGPIKVALAPFLLSCNAIMTLGIRPTIDDYSAEEKDLLRRAERVFFPTPRFAYLFNALRIPTFPAYTTYRFQRSRVLQQILLAVAGMPHPVTRIYYGNRQKMKIPDAFRFPFAAMGPDVALHKKHLVDNPAAFEECSRRFNPLIIQEAMEWTERVRILCVNAECVGAVRKHGRKRLRFCYEPAPMEQPALQSVFEMTRAFVSKAHLDDIVIDWAYGKGKWHALEMARPPVRWPLVEGTLNRHQHLCELVESGRL
jgi:ribosomal protein S6--L-glutamate ligase